MVYQMKEQLVMHIYIMHSHRSVGRLGKFKAAVSGEKIGVINKRATNISFYPKIRKPKT